MIAIVITCLVVVGIAAIIWNMFDRRNLPTGPTGLPVIGKRYCLIYIVRENIFIVFE